MQNRTFTRDYVLGIIGGMIFNVLAAGQSVYLGSVLQGLNPAVLIVTCFSLITLTLWAMQLKDMPHFLGLIRRDWRHVILINLMTIINWGAYFLAVKYIEPAVESAISLSIGPVVGLVISAFSKDRRMPTTIETIVSVGIMGCVLFLTVIGKNGLSGIGNVTAPVFFLGVACAILAGVFLTLVIYYTKHLFSKGWNSSQLLGCRFFFLIATASCFLPTQWFEYFHTSKNVWGFFLLTYAGILLPIMVAQWALKKISPFISMVLTAANPVFTIAAQYFDSRLTFSYYSLLGVVACTFFVCLGVAKPRK